MNVYSRTCFSQETAKLAVYHVMVFFPESQTGNLCIWFNPTWNRTGVYLFGIKRSIYRPLVQFLFMQKSYNPAVCNFHEELVENHYFVYFQNVRVVGKKRTFIRQIYMGFDNRGKPKRGRKVHRNDNPAHFQKFPAVLSRKKKIRRIKLPRVAKPGNFSKRKE